MIALRRDLAEVAKLVHAGERVLEIGCGDGALLAHLAEDKSVTGRGIEIDQGLVNHCAGQGLFVIQGDAENDLATYPDKAFDVVVLVRTLQTVNRPDRVLKAVARIGKRVIVTVPNFGHWQVRLDLLLRGRMPMTRTLDTPWYETDNIHFSTLKDFADLVRDLGLRKIGFRALNRKGRVIGTSLSGANWRADQGLFILEEG